MSFLCFRLSRARRHVASGNIQLKLAAILARLHRQISEQRENALFSAAHVFTVFVRDQLQNGGELILQAHYRKHRHGSTP